MCRSNGSFFGESGLSVPAATTKRAGHPIPREEPNMRYQIIARRMSPPGSQDYRHIIAVKYRNGSAIGSCTRDQMVSALEQGDTAFVQGWQHQSDVGIYELNGVKYLRSHVDGYCDDNLLSLPTF